MHPVGYFMFNTIRNHDRESFEIFCYSNRPSDDNLTCFFRDYSSRWRNLWKISTKEAARIIRQDRIDILVDLSGYSKDNRLDIFALKPAPIQVTWLGYPNTTGLKTIDYKMTDCVADPPGESDNLHSERLYRLPNGFLCFYPHPESPEVGPLPAKKSKIITFGSFNTLAKITPEVIKVWASILKRVSGSRLFLKRQSFNDPAVRKYFTDQFAAEGIGSERLLLKAHVGGAIEHLSLYKKLDIALDPFPYNGTTSTCESLWMGVPVVTLRGDRHAARVGASILSQVGLTEMIADSYEEYIAIAVRLANDLEGLQMLRKGMRKRLTGSPLCDGRQFTHNLEVAFQSMWREWCRQ
jgi:predicted O-linked N-acetylglucosamine transferase (SPINDLY family)